MPSFLGLHLAIWIVLAIYLAAMLALGWWSKRGIHDQEGFLMGNRRFGVFLMAMHSFGTGTHPGDVAGVTSKTVSAGASGVWVSWLWMFGTPFYWLIAPVVRRMRCLTVADYFEERFGRSAAILYVLVATIGMTVALASMLLATTRTVQGMMGKAEMAAAATALSAPGSDSIEVPVGAGKSESARPAAGVSARESDQWFFGILLVSTGVFVLYSYWGGLIAAVRADAAQGLMIIALSFLAIPAAMRLPALGGWRGVLGTVGALGDPPGQYLQLFSSRGGFSLVTILMLCAYAPLSMMAQPHLMTVCGAGRSEWEGRFGFTYGNILKRVCTMGWALLGLCWLAYLTKTGARVHPDAAFGDSVRYLLSPVLQGVMLSCVLAAAMSTGDAIQVTVAGLFTQNIYRRYLHPRADEARLVWVNRVGGVVIVGAATCGAILLRRNLVQVILDFVTITGLVGIASAMGILWRRMNGVGVYCGTICASAVFLWLRLHGKVATDLLWMHFPSGVPQWTLYAGPMAFGVLAGVIGSLVSKPPSRETIDRFFVKIHTPIGREDNLALPLDQAVPPERRWLTAGGLFIVKPTRQSWVGFATALAICLGCVATMLALIRM